VAGPALRHTVISGQTIEAVAESFFLEDLIPCSRSLAMWNSAGFPSLFSPPVPFPDRLPWMSGWFFLSRARMSDVQPLWLKGHGRGKVDWTQFGQKLLPF
jgi:hypothetical protein